MVDKIIAENEITFSQLITTSQYLTTAGGTIWRLVNFCDVEVSFCAINIYFLGGSGLDLRFPYSNYEF